MGARGPFRKPETSLLEQGEAATLPWAAGTGLIYIFITRNEVMAYLCRQEPALKSPESEL